MCEFLIHNNDYTHEKKDPGVYRKELTSVLLKVNPSIKKKRVKKGIRKAGKILLESAHIKKAKKPDVAPIAES